MDVEEIIDILLCGGSVDGELLDEYIDEVEEEIFKCSECESWQYLDNISITTEDGENICSHCQPIKEFEDDKNAFE
jgi:hypothetical protein